MRRSLVATAGALTLVIAGRAQQPPAVPQTTFKSGVDVVHVDVTVLDRDRRPVQGLRAADFVVKEDGKTRPVVAFTSVELAPKPVPPPALWMRDVAPDVVTNQITREGRLVVILLDHTIRREDMAAARRAAEAAVDQLGPADLAAVIFTTHTAPQNFTADRSILKAAINQTVVSIEDGGEASARGWCLCGGCTLGAMINVAEALRDVPERRKMLLFIGRTIPVMNAGSCGADVRTARERLIREAGVSNLTIHSIDSNLLETLAADAATRGVPTRNRTAIVGAHLERQGDLAVYPDHTGGRAIQNTNAPQDLMPAVFAESQFYYVLGFTPAAPKSDGSYHDIKVEVKRRDVTVHPRKGYYAPAPAVAETPTAAGEPPSSLVTAQASLWPATTLPLSVTAAAFAAPGTPEASIAVVVRAQHRDDAGRGGDAPRLARGEPLLADVLAGAYDRDGRPLSTHVQKLHVTAPPDSTRDFTYEALARLSLKPGRHEVRVAIEEPGHVAGSVYTYVEVPDFAKAPLSLSGVVLGTARPLEGSPLTAVLPLTPTARRQFRRTEDVSVFVRAYQGGHDPLGPVAIAVRILDRSETAVIERRTMLFEQPGTERSADYAFDLPLSSLQPGPYLLTLEATSAARETVRRDVRFEVVDPSKMTLAVPPPDTTPVAPSILRAAGAYLDQFERDVSAIVAEEDYLQRIPATGQSRRLRSDMLVIVDGTTGWVAFRDVFEVDGRPVRDRDERLAKLFLKPDANTMSQVRRVVEESTRFNLNPPRGGVNRTINQPFLALKFLRAVNQERSTFTVDSSSRGGEPGSVRLTFVVSAKPRLIASPDRAAAHGSFRIDPQTGRVFASELSIETVGTRATIRVRYAEQPKLALWLPVSMDESYGLLAGIEGHATYSNFRRFQVETNETIKK
jgi:VWFA-related protein